MKNTKTKKFNKLYFICMLSFILCSSAYIVYKYDALMSYNKQIDKLNEEIENATKTNEELTNQMEYKNSNEYIEKIAREKLGMIKNNEIVFYDNN